MNHEGLKSVQKNNDQSKWSSLPIAYSGNAKQVSKYNTNYKSEYWKFTLLAGYQTFIDK